MSEGPDPVPTSDVPVASTRRRVLFGLAAVMGSLSVFVIVAVLLAITFLPGRTYEVPDWLRERIDARMQQATPGMDVRFGQMNLIIARDWRPHVQIWDVEVLNQTGTPVLTLSQTEVALSTSGLLSGQAKPRVVTLAGAVLSLNRLEDGRFDLQLGETSPELSKTGDLASLSRALDAALQGPVLKSLHRVDLEALTVIYRDLRTGRRWTVDGGRLRATRKRKDLNIAGDFALLSGRTNVATLEMNFDSRIGEVGARMGLKFEDMAASDIATQSPALAWMEVLRAPISGAMRAEIDDDGQLGPLNASLQIGAGVVQPTDETKPIPFESAGGYLTYHPDTKRLEFTELNVSGPWVQARAQGVATLIADETEAHSNRGWPNAMLGQFQLTEITTNPNDLYDTALEVARADLDMEIALDPFRIRIGQFTVSDTAAPIRVNGTIAAARAGWTVALDADAAEVTPERVLYYWPGKLKPKTRKWIADNILAGSAHNAHVAFRARPGEERQLHLGLNFQDMTLRYMKTLPYLERASGHLTISNNRLVAYAESGEVQAPEGGKIKATGTWFEIPDVRVKEGPASVTLNTDSTVTAVLSLLDQKPFRFLSKAGQPVTLADGRMQADGRLDLVLKKKIKPHEIRFDIKGNASNLKSDKLVKGRRMSVPRAKLRATNTDLTITGKGKLGQVAFDGTWHMPLGKGRTASKVEATVTLSQKVIDEFGIGLPPGSVSGSGPGRLAMDIPGGKAAPTFTLTSNLSGVGLSLPPVAWSLPKARKGTLRVAGKMSSPPAIDTVSLDAPGLTAKGKVTLRADGGLNKASFSSVRVGQWLNAPVELIGRGKGRALAVNVPGGRLNMKHLPKMGGSGRGGAAATGPITLALDRLQITEGIALTGLRGTFNTAKGLTGEFVGQVNGSAPVTGRVVSSAKGTAFDIASRNAGRTLAATGLLKKAQGGVLNLSLRPTGREGHYDGVLKVQNTRLKDAPAMAELLHAVSIVGLLEQLGGQGIMFAEVDARFRVTPTQVIITQSSAIGPSMGVSLDGFYTLKDGYMDMQGVFSPLYLLNGIGSVLTRKGEGLFGFNFWIKGGTEKPKVGVNPLSVFTPGMFRELFRRAPPKVQR